MHYVGIHQVRILVFDNVSSAFKGTVQPVGYSPVQFQCDKLLHDLAYTLQTDKLHVPELGKFSQDPTPNLNLKVLCF